MRGRKRLEQERFFAAFVAVLLASGCWAAPANSAAKAAAEKAKQAWPKETKLALGCESDEFWSGGAAVASPKKSGVAAIRWDHHVKNGSIECLRPPRDLSAFNVMSFWLHSNRADGETFMIIFESRRAKNTFSYFSKKVKVTWTGWKRLEFHFRSFGRARSPVGWRKIDGLRFSASGWNQSPRDDSVWVIDEIDFSYTDKPYRPKIEVQKIVREPAPNDFLAKLRRNHPRLILLDEDLPRVKKFVSDDPLGQAWYANVKRRAESLYRRPVRRYELPDGRRLLSVSRDVCDRLYHWGFMYRMTHERKWLDRAWKEMEAVVRFKDWNPNHYLDTAEMMHAMGIGYDWFYKDLTEPQRKTIRDGLWQHGLRLSYASYMGLPAEGSQGWRKVTNNWNFVCNGGTSLAAMAVLDERPKECSEILNAAFQYIQIPLRGFEPDGAWWEGVGYWGYSMRYFLAYLRGLETAFGTDFGFIEALKKTGFAHTGDFPVYLVSPLGGIYNFADSGSGRGTYQHWGLFFLAEKFHNPLYLYFQLHHTRGGLHDILYYRPFKSDLAVQDVKLDKHFRGAEIATMRSSWTDPNALFVGVKCGKNGVAHAHQDLGSFIFYGLGERWLIDLGTERQTYLRHQHHLPRWQFYRIRAEGHNTLVFNPERGYCQDAHGRSKIVRFESSPGEVFAIADLTHAYRRYAQSVLRGYRLFDSRRALLAQDEIRSQKPNDLWWFAHTGPGVECRTSEAGRTAILQRNGKTCYAYVLSPADAKFIVMDAKPLPTSPNPTIQNPNKGLKKLALHLPKVKDATIAVLFAPVYDFEPAAKPTARVEPLESWKLPRAQAPRLSGLTLAGEALTDFSPNVFTYTVALPKTIKSPPTIEAKADAECEVRIEAPQDVPGSARITVRHKQTGAASLYLVRFLHEIPRGGTEKQQRKSKTVVYRGITVSASRDDGNVPQNVLDGNFETRWSANGTEEWIAFDFGKPRQIAAVRIAWYNGDQRSTRFKISVSDDGQRWRDVFNGRSTGKTTKLETYRFPKPETARCLRITCYGNTLNLWNSITEVEF